jgi:CHAT domain-containing protein
MYDSQKFTEALLSDFSSYYNDEKYYEALALALDYYDSVESFFDALSTETEAGELIGVLLLFCQNNDKKRAVKYATILIDLYTLNGKPEKIVELSYHISSSFDDPFASTSFQLIVKEGIYAVVQLLGNIEEAIPDEHIMVFICSNMLCFPGLAARDKVFAMSLIEKLIPHYKSEYKARLYVIACFLPHIKKGFERIIKQYEGLSVLKGVDLNEAEGYIQSKIYFEMLFPEGYPVLNETNPYEVDAKRYWQDEYIEMMKVQEILRKELLDFDKTGTFSSSELKERLDKLVEYYMNADMKFDDAEIVRAYHLVMCFSMCRFIDIDYVLDNTQPYAAKLMNYKPNDFTYANTISSIQTSVVILSEVYDISGDYILRYEAYLRYLELGNLHFKRVCFENGLDYFTELVKSDYSLFHSTVANALQVAFDNDFSLSPLYFEICKRKNLLYLGEVWQRQGSSAVEIRKLLEKDFTLNELQESIGSKRTLIDFIYVKTRSGKLLKDSEPDISDFTCLAFAVKSAGEVQCLALDRGGRLSENISDYENSIVYFKSIAEHTLQMVEENETLLICSDGDINRLSIAALPYHDGHVSDHYAVTNVGTVMDIVYPNKKKPIKSALLFTSPDYGIKSEGIEGSREERSWSHLEGSEHEGKLVANILTKEFGVTTEHLSGLKAGKMALLNKIGDGYDILHISTHGCPINDNIALVTAGANLSDKDTLILDFEIESYPLENTALAVLAIRDGAKQASALQDNLSGFIKSLLLSGVSTVIAPIRPVDDWSSAVLLSEFYRFYLGGQKPEGALQSAINSLRTMDRRTLERKYRIRPPEQESGEYPYNSPKYWASWVCFSKEEMEERL